MVVIATRASAAATAHTTGSSDRIIFATFGLAAVRIPLREKSRRGVEIRRRVAGPEHPDTLRTMVSLALVYNHQGKYAQAEALDSQILEIRRRLLGPEHQDMLMSMNNLATNYAEEGKYAQAVTTFRQVLEVQRRVVGPTHPDTFISMNNIAEAECSDPDLRQHCSGEALQLARAAVEGLPNEGGTYQTLGMAAYRNDRWAEGPTPPISSFWPWPTGNAETKTRPGVSFSRALPWRIKGPRPGSRGCSGLKLPSLWGNPGRPLVREEARVR